MQCEGSEAATITTGGAQFLNASSQLLDHYVSYVSTRMELEQLGALAFNFRVEVSSFRPAQGWGRAAHKHTYLSIYIYIYIERERETSIIYIYIYIYIILHTLGRACDRCLRYSSWIAATLLSPSCQNSHRGRCSRKVKGFGGSIPHFIYLQSRIQRRPLT